MADTIRTTTTTTSTDRKGKKRADPPPADEPTAIAPSPGKKAKKNPRQSLIDLSEKRKKYTDKGSKGKQPAKTMPRRPA